jgi:hypothetical protein
VAEASWKPLLDAAAALAHTDQHRDGLRACLRLIGGHWLPAGVREEAHRHLPRYAKPVAALWPEARWRELSLPGADSRAMRSPAPALVGGEIVVAVQAATAEQDDFAWTFLEVDGALRARSTRPLTDEIRQGTPAAVHASAIERLHPFVHAGRLLAFITSRDPQWCGRTQTSLAVIENDAMRDIRQLVGLWQGDYGIGWVPLPTTEGLLAVSSWEPTEILSVEPGTGEARRAALRPAPRLAERFRASSAAVAVPGGYLVLVNQGPEPVGSERPTLVQFVFLRSDFRVTAVSPHFWVAAQGEDVAGGLARVGDDLIAGVTSRGTQALLLRIPVAAVLKSLMSVSSPGDAVSM